MMAEPLEWRVLMSGYTLNSVSLPAQYPNGQTPLSQLVRDGSGNLFGTTWEGGSYGDGTVFEIAAGSTTPTTLVSFNGTNGDQPFYDSLTLDSSGNLYGTTYQGGPNNDGTVFEIKAGASSITTLATFTGTNGANPQGAVALDAAGDVFGTTRAGGGSNNDGTIFEVKAGTNSITTLATFTGTNGATPEGAIALDSHGNIFGTTEGYNSTAYSNGTVFELPAGSTSITTLVGFTGTNGANPYGGVTLDGSGNLYGTTYAGGTDNDGTVFAIKSGVFTSIASFTGGNGTVPYANLTLDASGDLFGTAAAGGANGAGTVFEIAAGSTTITTLASFNGTNGNGPQAAVTRDSAGNLFGTTESGGTGGAGAVFEIAAGSSTITDLASFGGGAVGVYPYGGLTTDAAGDMFGTTMSGGVNSDGTVFEIPAGTTTVTTLATFNGTNGSFPEATLTLDASGNLFGTTEGGGTYGDGTVFEIQAGTTTITTLASFNGTTGNSPTTPVTLDSSGNIFGVSDEGSASNLGTAFEIKAGTNAITVLANFSSTTGDYPAGGLTFDSKGNLWGTTSAGGSGYGTVFEIKSGTTTITKVASFSATTGEYPYAGLTLDASGNFWGTTYSGGSGYGTVFEVKSGATTITKIASFTSSTGENPEGGVTFDASGNLFVTTTEGGASGNGTVDEIKAGTSTLTALTSFTGDNGASPYDAPTLAPNGDLFGTANIGGAAGTGAVFVLSPITATVTDNVGGSSVTQAKGTAVAGSTVVYTIKVSNPGPFAATNVTVSDPVPTGVSSLVWSGNGKTNVSGAINNDTIASLAAGSSVIYMATATITPSATGTVASTATVGATANTTNSANNTATDTDTLTTQSDVSVTVSDNVGGTSGPTATTGTATPGGSVTYTVVVSNAGPSTASNVLVTDPLPTGVTAFSWSGNGKTNQPGALSNTIATLAPGASVTYTVVATISASASGSLSNTATVSAANDTNSANNSATDTDNLQKAATSLATPTVPSTALVGNTLTASTTLTRTDGLTNNVAGVTVTFTLTAPSSNVTTLTSTTNAVGSVSVVFSALSLRGVYSISASFAGTGALAASASATATTAVYQEVQLAFSPATVLSTESDTTGPTITAVLTSVPQGTPLPVPSVYFTAAGIPWMQGGVAASSISGNAASYVFQSGFSGTFSISASIPAAAANANFYANSTGTIGADILAPSGTVTIAPAVASLAAVSASASPTLGNPVTLSTVLTRTSAPSGPLVGQTVTFTVTDPGGQMTSQTAITAADGSVSVQYTPTTLGAYSVVASYAPVSSYPGSPAIGAPYSPVSSTTATVTVAEVPGLTVTTNQDVVNPTDGLTSLREAIAYADAIGGGTIMFASNVTGTITLTQGALSLNDPNGSITIQGPGAGALAISGHQSSEVFDVTASTNAEIDGLTIENGLNANAGGGIAASGALTLNNDSILNNNTSSGGGGVFAAALLLVNNCVFSGNTASSNDGGAIQLYNPPAADQSQINNSTIIDNSAAAGGGVFSSGTLSLTDDTISDNTAGGGLGGGVGEYGGSVAVAGSTFTLNSGFEGAGFYDQGGTSQIINSTFTSNTSVYGAALFFAYTTQDSLISDTIANNAAYEGAVQSDYNSSVVLYNTIVASTSGNPTYGGLAGDVDTGEGGTISTASANNLIDDARNSGGITNGVNGNIVGHSAGLGTLGNYGEPTQTIPLLPGSPAIGAGAVADIPGGVTTDQRGQPRTYNGSTDIGAFQTQGYSQSITGGNNQSVVNGKTFTTPLQVTVTANHAGDPVAGGVISFTAPTTGASAALSRATATITSSNTASVTATANSTLGNYNVSAGGAGIATPAAFSLANDETPSLIVTTNQDVVNPTDGLTSLREAIAYADAQGGGTINFASNLAGQTITLDGSHLELAATANPVTIDASSIGGITISGNTASNLSSNVFQVDSGATVYFTDLTIINGQAIQGGGIAINSATVKITNCTLSNDTATTGGGGGIYAQSSTLTLTNCTLSSDTADDVGNESGNGGGIYALSSTVTVTNSTLSNDAADLSFNGGSGGGIYNSGGTMTVTDSTLSNDTDYNYGGGIYNSGTLTVTDSTLSNDSSAKNGGGIYNDVSGQLTITDSTLTNDSSTGITGGGIDNISTFPVTITDSTLSNNKAAGLVGGDLYSAKNSSVAYNSIFTDSIAGGLIGSNNLLITAGLPASVGTVEPSLAAFGLGTLGNYGGPTQTIPLLPGSPAIGAGVPIAGVTTDQRGVPRPATPDIGAYQYDYNLVVNTTADNVNDDNVSGPTVTLREAVNFANTYPGSADITFDPSVFGTAKTITLASQLNLTNTSSLTITGPGASLLKISGGDATRVFYMNGGAATLSGLTISDGSASGGAGLDVISGTVTLTNVTVANNTAQGDGTSDYGGGVNTETFGSVILNNVTFSHNSTIGGDYSYGGGLNNDGNATLTDVTFVGNSNFGGSDYNDGGAMVNYGTATLTNVTMAGNLSSDGAGLFNDGTATLTDVTIAQNSGLGIEDGPTQVTMTNTLVAQNTGGDISSSYTGTNDLVGGNPLLGTLGNYGGPTQTIPLLPGSPAIGAGVAIAGVTTDQTGYTRSSTAPSIGAYENEGFTIIATGGGQTTAPLTAFATPLGVKVSSNNPLLTNLSGGTVTFTAPSTGASATFGTNPITLAADGSGSTTVTANGSPGSYNVTASASGITNAATFVGLTNAKLNAQIQLGNLLHTYTGSPLAASVTTTPAGLSYTITYTQNNVVVASPTAAGTYWVTVTINDSTYQGTMTGSLVIGQAMPSLSLNVPSGAVYTGSSIGATATIAGVNNLAGSSLEGVPLSSITYAPYTGGSQGGGAGSTTPPTAAGTYLASVSFAGSTDYTAGSTSQVFTIAQATSATKAVANSVTYNGNPFSAGSTVTGAGGLSTVATTFSYAGTGTTAYGPSATPPTNAGSYTVTAIYNGDANHTGSSGTVTFTIYQATPTISVVDGGGVFNGSPYGASGTVTGVNGTNLGSPYYEYFLASDTSFSSPSTTAPTAAGSYVAIGFSPYNANYVQVGQAAYFSITPAKPTVAVTTNGGTYTGSAIGATATVTGVSGPAAFALESVAPTLLYYAGQTASGIGTATAPTNVGTYTVVATFPGSADYSTASTSKTFSITPAATVVTVSDAGGTYNGSPSFATGTVTGAGGLSTTPTFSFTGTGGTTYSSATAPTNAGTYAVTATYAGDANHTGNTATVGFTIAQATPSISVTDTGGVYNALPYAAMGTTTGVNGTPLGSPTYRYYLSSDTSFSNPTTTAPTDVGSYVLIALSPVNSNYIQVGQAVYFSITQASSVLAPVATSVTYGGSTTLSTTLKTSGGALLAGRTVTFSVNGKVIGTAVTNSAGVASLGDSVAGITPGVYGSGIAVSFAGDSNSTATSATASLTVLDAPIVSSVSVSNLLNVANLSGSFTQTRTGAAASDFVATVNWGDGNTQTLLVVADLLHPGQFDLVGLSHIYLQLNQKFTVTVTISTVGKFGSVVGNTASYVTTIIA
jgi:CSLREA domain-containing protein